MCVEAPGPHPFQRQTAALTIGILEHFPENIFPYFYLKIFLSRQLFLFFSFFFFFLIGFRERGRERERERERNIVARNINQLSPVHALTKDQTCNLGMCPDQGLNLQPFGQWDDAATN